MAGSETRLAYGFAVGEEWLNSYFWNGTVSRGPLRRKDGTLVLDGQGRAIALKAITADYVPVWFRYYLKPSSYVWPYAGVGIGLHVYKEDVIQNYDDVTSLSGAVPYELGLEIGGQKVRHRFSARVFHKGPSPKQRRRIAFIYGLGFGG